MLAPRTVLTVTTLALITLASGCQPNERIRRLEQDNQELSDVFNRCRDDLEACKGDVAERDRLLAALRTDNENLRAQLAALPPPGEVAPGWTAVPGGAMIALETDVLFASGRATLRREAEQALNSIAATLNGEYADKDVIVFGHTDDEPIKKSGWKDNWQLSTERALTVVRYLRDNTINPDRLVACGAGEYRPRGPNDSAANRQHNRRVEIYAIDASLLRPR